MTTQTSTSAEIEKTLKGFSALAQDTRLKTFRLLMKAGADGLPAGKIATELDVTPNKLTAHLNVLTEVELLQVERQGRHMIYSVNKKAVAELMQRFSSCCCDGAIECKGELENS